MTTKKPGELPPEETREQMSLYQRLFCQKTKNSPEYQEALRQSQTQHFLKRNSNRNSEEEQKRAQVKNNQKIWENTKRIEMTRL